MSIDNLYIAAKFEAGPRVAAYAPELEKLGFRVISQWWDTSNPALAAWDSDFNSKASRVMASYDADNIMQSKVFILDTFDVSESGGREVELGMALMMSRRGLDIRIIRVGPARNIFHSVVREQYNMWETVMAVLRNERATKRNMGND